MAWGPLLVERRVGDVKPAFVRRSATGRVEVAAAEQPLLHRLEPALPATHALVRGHPVLDEVQPASGPEDAPHLRSAAATSGIVHIVHVERAASKLSSANGSDWPSSPARCTGTVVALTRRAASFQPTSAGSTAATRVTVGG